jgi:transcriptional regulator with XRE-family HTH domain
MKGESIRKKIRLSSHRLNDVAEKMGISPQALNNILNAEDVKTGSLERIAEAMNLPITYFYGDTTVSGVSGNVMMAEHGGVNNSEQQSVAVLAEQLSTKDKQIDRLLGIIENLNK